MTKWEYLTAPILTHALRAQHSLLVAELRQGSRPSRLRILWRHSDRADRGMSARSPFSRRR